MMYYDPNQINELFDATCSTVGCVEEGVTVTVPVAMQWSGLTENGSIDTSVVIHRENDPEVICGSCGQTISSVVLHVEE